MKTKFLIIIPVMAGITLLFPLLLDSLHSDQNAYEDTFQYTVETDFKNKIRETGDDSATLTFLVNNKQDLISGIDRYCGFAHMETEEYWYFADTKNKEILSSNLTQNANSWCGDEVDSCYCELSEHLGMKKSSYEEFFREHVSRSCPVIPMPENAHSFDPIECKWILGNEN